MDFVLTEDQSALQEGVRKQLAARFPMGEIRAMEAASGVHRGRWEELAAAGVFGLRLAESDGGVGLGMAESVLVFEELGRALVPGPLVATSLAAPVVDGAAAGRTVAGIIERSDRFVENLAVLDVLVVLDDHGVWLLPAAAVEGVPAGQSLDPLTPIHRISGLAQGERIAGEDDVARWRSEGALLTSALQLGIAEAVTDRGVAYAKERVQFDKPIGAFQAVKHLLADMLVRTEIARAAVYAAAVTADDPDVGDVGAAVSGAKILAGEAALANAKACVQVHGGMGFTWEVDVHLYLKRAWVLDTIFGTADDHAEGLAELL